ncbi:DsrE family protein [Kushneria aurantia]|uniref:DsrE family protein n=1 Tax=Kushneria aurantia TaxID=504092 RepID=A0ABV6G482_9GAMM|nr:DsrE family protein [Kushneria aurantia]
MSDRSMLVLIRQPPHGSSRLREGIEAALVGAALGTPPTVLFSGDGVLALLRNQHAGALEQKGTAGMIAGMTMYDIEPLYYDAVSLTERGLTPERLVEGCEAADSAVLIDRHDVVLSF